MGPSNDDVETSFVEIEEETDVTTPMASNALKAIGVSLSLDDVSSTLVLLDINVTSPLIKIPPNPYSQDYFEGTFGSIQVKNFI